MKQKIALISTYYIQDLVELIQKEIDSHNTSGYILNDIQYIDCEKESDGIAKVFMIFNLQGL